MVIAAASPDWDLRSASILALTCLRRLGSIASEALIAAFCWRVHALELVDIVVRIFIERVLSQAQATITQIQRIFAVHGGGGAQHLHGIDVFLVESQTASSVEGLAIGCFAIFERGQIIGQDLSGHRFFVRIFSAANQLFVDCLAVFHAVGMLVDGGNEIFLQGRHVGIGQSAVCGGARFSRCAGVVGAGCGTAVEI